MSIRSAIQQRLHWETPVLQTGVLLSILNSEIRQVKREALNVPSSLHYLMMSLKM